MANSIKWNKKSSDVDVGHLAHTSAGKKTLRLALFLSVLLLIVMTALGWWWSQTPSHNKVEQQIAEKINGVEDITGVHTTAALIATVETLYEKRGSLITNDITPPSIFIENIKHWEYGVIIQARDLSKAMRDSFSRSQSQSQEDESLALAEPRLNFELNSWMLPSTESEYRSGVEKLNDFFERLTDEEQQNAQFFARSDNLQRWLMTVENRLGSLSQRLSASVGQKRLNTDLAGDAEATQSTPTLSELTVATPWYEVDDVFFEARGTTWALLNFMRAVEQDFASVLEKKNALVSLQQIIRELEATQERLKSPIVMNGGRFGMFANHSLVMASYISRAHAAIIDLRDLMSNG